MLVLRERRSMRAEAEWCWLCIRRCLLTAEEPITPWLYFWMHRTAWLWPSQLGVARLSCLLRHFGTHYRESGDCLLPEHGDQSRLRREECDISVCQGSGLEKVFYKEPYTCTIPRSAWQVWSRKLHCVWNSQKNKTKSLEKCSLSPLLWCSLSLRCRHCVVDALADCGWGPHC